MDVFHFVMKKTSSGVSELTNNACDFICIHRQVGGSSPAVQIGYWGSFETGKGILL